MKEHRSEYQARDREVVDYQMYELRPTGLQFRGPAPPDLKSSPYFSCLGAAQTFGCFCDEPYPQLLSGRIGLPALNLGYGGAGPSFFLKHHALFDYVNRGSFAIVQVMSGRSESNSAYDSGGLEYLTRRRDGRKFSAADGWRSVLEGGYVWNRLPVGKGWARKLCQARGRKRARQLVVETREAWVENCCALLNAIRCPKVLVWFSKRSPDLKDDFTDVNRLFGEFPQLVNREMMVEVRKASDEYVECVTERGSPQPLISRFTGQPCSVELADDRADFAGIRWTHNPYYPSPEMHVDVTERLLAADIVRAHRPGTTS